jgi:uncharacterized protein
MRWLRGLAVLVLAWGASGPLMADPYPAYQDLFVNDYAEVLAPADESDLRAKLSALKAETGIEMTVLTIQTRADYDASPSIEAFATGLFNAWGVGDATRDDGLLVLVATVDREMRLELGAGYDTGYDVLAGDMVDRYFLPGFRDQDYAGGIRTGVDETIRRIARRHAARLPPEALPAAPGGGLPAWPFAVAIFGGAAALMLRGPIGALALRARRCPQCGSRTLERERDVLMQPSGSIAGRAREITRCRTCTYRDTRDYSLPARGTSKGSRGSFGGGKSRGGGATGRW